MRVLVLLITAPLLACSYTPPRGVDTRAATYHADLEACDSAAKTDVNKQNAKKGMVWLASGVTRWGDIDDARSACMVARGYGRSRACTQEELRSGNRSATLTVTAAGIRCFDPATGVRPADTAPPAAAKSGAAVAKPPR